VGVGSRGRLASCTRCSGALLFLATHGCDADHRSSLEETPPAPPASFMSAGDFALDNFLGEEEEGDGSQSRRRIASSRRAIFFVSSVVVAS
jgi:hypothetical protein